MVLLTKRLLILSQAVPFATAWLVSEAPLLRGEVTRAVGLGYAPQLRFEADATFDASDRVTQLLNDPRVARDLDKPQARKRQGRPRRG